MILVQTTLIKYFFPNRSIRKWQKITESDNVVLAAFAYRFTWTNMNIEWEFAKNEIKKTEEQFFGFCVYNIPPLP